MTETTMAASTTDLIVSPHPLTTEGRTVTRGAELQPGDTLARFVARAGVDLARPGWHISIGGAEVPELMWSRTRPAHGQLIEVRRTAEKSALRLVALVALAYLTIQTGGAASALASAMGTSFSTFTALAINTAAFVLGSMVINRVLGPSALGGGAYAGSTGTTYSLQGGRNRGRLFEPLGLLFGQVRVVPDFAAQPYSVFESDDQYQHLRLHAGLNCGAVTDLKIGDTPIASYEGVTVQQSGFPGGPVVLMNFGSVDSVAGGLLDAVAAPGAWVTRTTSVGTVRIAVDLSAQLYQLGDYGENQAISVTLEAQHRLLPAGAWLPLVGASATLVLSNRSTKPLRRTYTLDVASGQYEVRLRKMTANVTSSRSSNVVDWVQLKSTQYDTTDYSGQPQVNVRVKASGQLQGVLDEVSWLATSEASDLWDGSAWSTVPNSNPGAHFLRFARGGYLPSGRLAFGMGKPDSQIDLEAVQAFMVHCTAKGYCFDHWLDARASCGEVLEAIAGAGLGSVSYHTGKLGLVWAAEDQPIEAVLSPVRMKPGTFRIEYATRELADELEVTWPESANNWLPATARLLAPGVTVPRETARLAPVGATTLAGGLLQGRFAMAQNIYQRKAVSWEMDLEHITFHRFSMLAMSHDVTQWGYSGRLHAAVNVAGVVTITLDMEVPFNSGAAARYVALHIPGEAGYRVFGVAAFSGTTHTLTLSGAWPVGVALPGSSSSNPAHDTVWLYDFSAQPGLRMRVVDIQPTANLAGAKVTAVPEPDEFWAYVASGAYVAPAAAAVRPGVMASGLRVTQELLILTTEYATELSIMFEVSGPYDHAQVWGAADGNALQLLGETRTTRYSGWRVQQGQVLAIEVRPFDQLGRPGTVAAAGYSVALVPYQPLAPTGLTATVAPYGVLLQCAKNAELIVVGYEWRVGAVYATAQVLDAMAGTSYPWRMQVAGSYTVWVAAVDYFGTLGPAVSMAVTLTAPTIGALTAAVVGPDLQLDLTAAAGSFAIAGYQISHGSSWAGSTAVGEFQQTRHTRRVDWAGTRRWWVAAVDAAGNVGAAASVDVTVTAPGVVTGTRSEVVDNNVLLYWAPPATGSLPVDRYEVRKGASWAAGTLVGSNGNSTFTTVFEQQAGNYSYWIAAIDSAGTEGAAVAIVAAVTQPPDYVLTADYNDDFSGITLSGMYLEAGRLYGPALGETIQTHFESRGWATPDAQIAAGYPLVFEPGGTSGYCERTMDYGTALPPTVIAVTVGSTVQSGAVAMLCQISYKALAGDAWTDAPAGDMQVLATGFRYAKVRLTFTSTGGDDLIELASLNIKLSSKLKTDSGTGTVVVILAGGTTVNFNVDFIDVQSILVTPSGTAARYAIYDFVDTPNPTSFKVLLFNSSGVPVTGGFSWTARGY